MKERMSNPNAESEKVLDALRKSGSATLRELSALSGIDEEDLETIVQSFEKKNIVRVSKRGNPFHEIVTLREVAFAAGQGSV